MRVFFLFLLFTCPLLTNASPPKLEDVIAENHSYMKEELTVSEIKPKGKFIILSDGSEWEVSDKSLSISQSWFIPHEMKIEASNDPDYPYKIINKQTGSFVLAKKKSSG